MGYKYRQRKRKCAHNLLNVLVIKYEVSIKSKDGITSNAREYYPISIMRLTEELPKYNVKEITDAGILLESNEHIRILGTWNDVNVTLNGTAKGREAYKEGFYLVENDKDRLQRAEYLTKLIIPIASLIISLISISISIITYFSRSVVSK